MELADEGAVEPSADEATFETDDCWALEVASECMEDMPDVRETGLLPLTLTDETCWREMLAVDDGRLLTALATFEAPPAALECNVLPMALA